MFSNFLEQRLYVQEVVDPITGRHYNVHIYSLVPKSGYLSGFIVNDIYLTDSDPKHGVLVCIGRKAFAEDEYETKKEMAAELEKVIHKCLPSGFKRYEAIMESGISGNELL